MAPKAILTEDEFGELDELTKGFYAQGEDGKYAIDLDGIDDHPKVRALKSGHQRSKAERDEAKRKATDFQKRFGKLAEREDLDLSEMDEDRLEALMPYLTGEAELPTGDDGKRKTNGDGKGPDLDKIKANARKPVERERDEAVERATKAETKLESLIRDSALTEAVSEIKVAGPFTKAVKAMFRDKVKVIEGDDGEPVAMIEGEYGEQPVAKYLKEWSQTDEGKEFVVADRNGGGGTRMNGSGSGKIKNPWATDNWSPKEQARVYREQGKDVAARMAAEHGKKVL